MADNTDRCNREITYLRVSITDRCNLRCLYCMSPRGVRLLDHADILSYEEILRVVEVSARLGITKVRLTGGEPLLRRNVCELVRAITNVPGVQDVSLTTNGVLLQDMARPLRDAGLRRINVSLDTLSPLNFRRITRRDLYSDVWRGIREAETVGFDPIRINVVTIRGINDDELGRFAQLSREKPYSFRFIEYMPTGNLDDWDVWKFMPADEIRTRLEEYGPLLAIPRNGSDGPSCRFRFPDGVGEIGLISPISHHFCDSCNRLRLTADGKLRSCLFSDFEVDVKGPLRDRCSDTELARLIRESIAKKPKKHGITTETKQGRLPAMSRIGG